MNSIVEDRMEKTDTTAAITVRHFADGDADRWEEFVDLCHDATFFHRIGWKNILEECFGHRTHYLLAERQGHVVGILPLSEVKTFLFGHAVTSLPFCVYGGVAAVEGEAMAALHQAARLLCHTAGADYLELRNRRVCEAEWPRQNIYVTFRKNILPDVDANLMAIPRKQRAMVRKGIDAGLKSEIDVGVERFFALYADNVHRHGTPPLPKRYFARLRDAFPDNTEVLTIVDATSRPVSSVFSFYFRDEVCPYYAGDDVRARQLAANDFKYWELMRRACLRGIRIFDYGRSKAGTGPYHFKKNWGFEPVRLAYEYCLLRRDSIPENNPLNPKYRMLVAAWKRLPLRVANFVGPHLIKGLG